MQWMHRQIIRPYHPQHRAYDIAHATERQRREAGEKIIEQLLALPPDVPGVVVRYSEDVRRVPTMDHGVPIEEVIARLSVDHVHAERVTMYALQPPIDFNTTYARRASTAQLARAVGTRVAGDVRRHATAARRHVLELAARVEQSKAGQFARYLVDEYRKGPHA